MPPTFQGRIEAKMVNPSSAAVSVTIPNGAGATSVTAAPAASYYLTAAGGVSGLLATMETALNDNVQGYPRTAAAATSALGQGSFTGGAAWLFDIASGNDSGAFGGVTMTAVSSPTYGTDGPRGGIDKAVGFNSANDAFSAGNVYNVGATDDLLGLLVVKQGSSANADMMGKLGAAFWLVRFEPGNGVRISVSDGVDTVHANSATEFIGEYVAIVFYLERATNMVGIAVKGLTSGTVATASADASAVGALTNAANLTVGDHGVHGATNSPLTAFAGVVTGSGKATGVHANIATVIANWAAAVNASWSVSLGTDGRISIGWTGYTTPTWSLSWTDTTLRDVCGFTANISGVTTAQVSAKQADGIWYPDCPLNCERDPYQAPLVSDLRTSQSPTGVVLGLTGNTFYRHRNIRWTHVPRERVWESEVTYANASWEHWFSTTQLGAGHSWFSVSSPVQIYWSNAGVDTLLGGAANSETGLSGWTITGLDSIEPAQSVEQWSGLFRIELPALVSSG